MRSKLAIVAMLGLSLTGCCLVPHVTDGPDRHDRDAVVTTTDPVVSCAALGCPGNPPDDGAVTPPAPCPFVEVAPGVIQEVCP